eukprot:13958-Heterococcus_DN1.PRE.1
MKLVRDLCHLLLLALVCTAKQSTVEVEDDGAVEDYGCAAHGKWPLLAEDPRCCQCKNGSYPPSKKLDAEGLDEVIMCVCPDVSNECTDEGGVCVDNCGS